MKNQSWPLFEKYCIYLEKIIHSNRYIPHNFYIVTAITNGIYNGATVYK